jgi:hypothetical protein
MLVQDLIDYRLNDHKLQYSSSGTCKHDRDHSDKACGNDCVDFLCHYSSNFRVHLHPGMTK